MKVLLVSASPINQEVGIGNTFLNIMPKEMQLASIYTRNGVPDKRIEKAFCINEKMIIGKILGKNRNAGMPVIMRYGEKQEIKSKENVNEDIIRLAQKKRYTIMFWMQGFIWRINVWKSEDLKRFINEFNPDLIFTLFANNIYLNRIILHILKISKKPLVLYAWDNNYQWNKYQRSPLRWANQFFERFYMRKVMKKAKKLYVISDIQRQDYERNFHKKCTVLTKGVDFLKCPHIKKKYNNPLQLVYTGNIGNSRWKSLAMIANVLERINRDGVKGQLKIYTATPLTKEMNEILNQGKSSIIIGHVPANLVTKIQQDADVLVHVEAFDNQNKFVVRQSFSTKIVDYLYVGRPILAVGPRDIASIDYFIKNDAGMVATNDKEILDILLKMLEDHDILREYSKKAYESGKKNHDREKNAELLRTDFDDILKETSYEKSSIN